MFEHDWETLARHYGKLLLPDDWTLTIVVDPFTAGEGLAVRAKATTDWANRTTRLEFDSACTPDAVTVIHELLHPLSHDLRALFQSVCRTFIEPDKAATFTTDIYDKTEEEFVEGLARRLARHLPGPLRPFSPCDCDRDS